MPLSKEEGIQTAMNNNNMLNKYVPFIKIRRIMNEYAFMYSG